MLSVKTIEILEKNGWTIKEDQIEKKYGDIWAIIPYETVKDIFNYDFNEDEFINEFYQANEEYSPEGLYACANQIVDEVLGCANELDEMMNEYGIEDLSELTIEDIVDVYTLDLSKDNDGWKMEVSGFAPAYDEYVTYEYCFGHIKDVNQLQQGINDFLRNFDKEDFVKEKMGVKINHEYPLSKVFTIAEEILFDIADLQGEIWDETD